MTLSDADKRPFRWPVTHTQTLQTTPDQLWRLITRPGNLETCHPFCDRNPVEQWPGVGARDAVHYYSGLVLYRRFTAWVDGVGYDLEIGKRQGKQSTVQWRIAAVGQNRSRLAITIQAHDLQHLPLAQRWVRHQTYLRPILKSYLASVLQGFAWYVDTGQSVSRNQFGSHPWFSPD